MEIRLLTSTKNKRLQLSEKMQIFCLLTWQIIQLAAIPNALEHN